MILAAVALSVCPPPPARRVTCVVDGDTVWVDREKIRLANIDAPELHGKCPRETALAVAARDRLATLLRPGFRIHRTGTDRYGRTLATITIDGIDVGRALVIEGLAREWTGRREPWC